MRSKQEMIYLFMLAMAKICLVQSFCPYPCQCGSEPRSCKAGVSLVMDGCNCCKVCAKQLGQQCNNDDSICDTHHNLFCDFTASRSGDWGVCKARHGRSCFHEDVVISSGSMFKPSCKKRCWCIDGAVGCIPTCPHESQTPRSDLCPNARLQRVPGECCDKWTCQSPGGKVRTLPLDNFWDEYVDDREEITPFPEISLTQLGNGVRDGPIYDDVGYNNIDELRDYQNYPISNIADFAVVGDEDWKKTNIIPGDIDAHLFAQSTGHRCKRQSSAWSACSKTCGLGVSSRVTNTNPECRLVREQRLCEIRPCNNARYQPKKKQQCLRHKRSRKRVTLKYAGCVSVKKMKQRYCGSCHDNSRCCTPKVTRTSRVQFRCDNGHVFLKNILVVRSCHCHKSCITQSPVRVEMLSALSLHDDMHRSSSKS